MMSVVLNRWCHRYIYLQKYGHGIRFPFSSKSGSRNPKSNSSKKTQPLAKNKDSKQTIAKSSAPKVEPIEQPSSIKRVKAPKRIDPSSKAEPLGDPEHAAIPFWKRWLSSDIARIEKIPNPDHNPVFANKIKQFLRIDFLYKNRWAVLGAFGLIIGVIIPVYTRQKKSMLPSALKLLEGGGYHYVDAGLARVLDFAKDPNSVDQLVENDAVIKLLFLLNATDLEIQRKALEILILMAQYERAAKEIGKRLHLLTKFQNEIQRNLNALVEEFAQEKLEQEKLAQEMSAQDEENGENSEMERLQKTGTDIEVYNQKVQAVFKLYAALRTVTRNTLAAAEARQAAVESDFASGSEGSEQSKPAVQ
mmetsp:Transcript_6082/g.10800  ORF Transcript_6082/g.10800 Transcript_6082/m.10800 type:complete len:362 (+) Transcript_6082:181-1266(+)